MVDRKALRKPPLAILPTIKELMDIMKRSRGSIKARIEKLELEEKYS